MTTFLIVAGVVLAAAFASFACVIIERLPLALDEPNEFGDLWDTRPWGEVLGGRSRCSSCGADVRPRDNIPVIGWLLLRGRCRDCSAPIPAFHPIIEVLIPLSCVLVGLAIGRSLLLVPALLVTYVGVIVSVIDLRTMIVPTRLVWPATGIVVVLSLAVAAAEGILGQALLGGVFGALTLSGPLFAVWWIHPRGMGFGDVRLAVLLGWTAGLAAAWTSSGWVSPVFNSVVAMVLASTIGIVFGLVAAGLHRPFPFGPSLVAGTLVAVAFAPEIHQIIAT